MSAPWEKYAQATPPPSAQPAPWEKYGSQNAQPGVESIGVANGPTPAAKEGAAQKVVSGLKTGLGAGAKVLDTPRGLTGAPLLGGLLDLLTGKDAYTLKDLENTIDPTTTKHAPSSAEMFERAGVPEGAKLSDVMGGYSEPGQGQHWYSAEKGGMLDPTLRGTGGLAVDTAIDPLTYLSFGASAVAKQAAEKSAAKVAMKEALEASKNAPEKLLNMAGDAAGAVGPLAMNPGLIPAKMLAPKVAEITAESPFLQNLTKVAQLPSKAVGAIGKRMYGSPMMAIEHGAERFGKASPGEILYQGGVMTPNNLPAKAQGIVDTVLGKRNDILDMAGQQGGRMDMQAAMEPARAQAASVRKADLPNQGWIADELEKQVGEHLRPTKSPGYDPAALAEYGPKFKQFLQDKKAYGQAFGDAGKNESQAVLPGMVDDLQRTVQRPRSIELEGKAADMMSIPTAVPSEQTYLSSIPQWDEAAQASFDLGSQGALNHPVHGFRNEALNMGRQKDALDYMTKGEISSLGKQGEFAGGDLVNRSYANIVAPSVEATGGQSRMLFPPTRPQAPSILPGRQFTPREGAQMTTNLYNDTPDAVWNSLRKTPGGAKVTKPLFSGTRQEYLNATERALGPEARKSVEDFNATAGPLLSTGRAQERVSRQAERTLNSATSIDGVDAALAPIAAVAGSDHGLEKGLWSFLGRKAMQTARYGQMPVGYGVRKLAEGEMTGPALDALLREKFIKHAGTPANPWSNIGDDNGR